MLRTLNLTVIGLMILLAIPLAAATLYFFLGSQEEFPTEEQEEKIRVVAGLIIAVLLLTEGTLFLIQRKIKNSINRQRPLL